MICLQGSNARAAIHELRDFHHVVWTLEKGVGAVPDIQQAPDGYLWLTTPNGIFRFDGVRFQSVDEATNGAVHNRDLDIAFVSRNGSLFLSARRDPELLLWRDGHLTKFPDRRCKPGVNAEGIAEGREGSLWIQGSAGLAHLHNGVCEHVGNESGYSGGFPAALLMDRRGTLWVKARSGDLMIFAAGQSRFERVAHGAPAEASAAFLHEAPDGSIWLSDSKGLRRITGRNGAILRELRKSREVPFENFTFAADGSLWAATVTGLERFAGSALTAEDAGVVAGEGASFTPQQGLSSIKIWKVFTDKEGMIWVGTNSGLDQFRRTALSPLPMLLGQQRQFAVAAGNAGTAWIGSLGMALTNITEHGIARSFPETEQSRSVQCDLNGGIWAAGYNRSRLWRTEGATAVPVHTPHEDVEAIANIAVDKNGEPWINTFAPNVYRRVGDKWEQQNQILGRKPGVIGTMRADNAGNVWFAFSSSLVEWDGHANSRYSSAPLDISVATLAFRDDRVWIGGVTGIELFQQGHFWQMRWKDEDLPGRVTGVVETREGDLWVNGFSGVVHVTAPELVKWLRNPSYAVLAERLGAPDGLPGLVAERWPEPSLVESPEGRLWFATSRGVAWLDPDAYEKSRNRLPPPVLITVVNGDGTAYPISSGLRLAAHTGNIQFDYTALSLAVPERVHFRYKLEPADDRWQDVGTRRQAFYSNLPAGGYRFRVIACNNDGVWNDEGAVVGFKIMPAFYETWWFKTLCGLLLSAVLWMVIRLRIGAITHQLEVRLADRLAERERIARELHDTLLQSFQGSLIQMEAARISFSQRPEQAAQTLDEAITMAESAIAESRDAIQDLRSQPAAQGDLADLLNVTGQNLARSNATDSEVVFRVTVEGERKDLDPLFHDEAYRIARELLRNAFRHAHARHIEADIRYEESLFQMRIRDDGIGIDPETLKAGGRAGHWGLLGMQERAKRIGAQLNFWSRAGAGTEVELSIPSSVAYDKAVRRTTRLQLLRKKANS